MRNVENLRQKTQPLQVFTVPGTEDVEAPADKRTYALWRGGSLGEHVMMMGWYGIDDVNVDENGCDGGINCSGCCCGGNAGGSSLLVVDVVKMMRMMTRIVVVVVLMIVVVIAAVVEVVVLFAACAGDNEDEDDDDVDEDDDHYILK